MAKQPAVRCLKQIPGCLERQRTRRTKLDAYHQAFSANLFDEFVALYHPLERGEQARTCPFRVLHQPFGFNHLKCGKSGRHGQIVLGKCRPMHDGTVHSIENLVEYPFAGQHRANRDMPAGQRLGQQNDVGLDAPMFAGKKAPGSPKSGLDFIGNKQCAVLAAKLERRTQVIVRRNGDAFALDRLDDERRNRFRGQAPVPARRDR